VLFKTEWEVWTMFIVKKMSRYIHGEYVSLLCPSYSIYFTYTAYNKKIFQELR
jgi:hypothetical protein